VGLKATYGRVSRWGVFPLSYSLDHVTMMTRTVRDGAFMLQAASGHDVRDENSLQADVPDFSARIGRDIRGMRIGVGRGYTYEDVDPEVTAMVRNAARTLESLGATVEEVRLPYVEYCLETYAAILNPEAAVVHYDNLRQSHERFGAVALGRLDLGNIVPATAYVHAQRVRKLMRDALRGVFERYDAIISPAAPVITGAAGIAGTSFVNGREIPNRELEDGYTNYHNLTGTPAIVLPGGFSHENTPIGLQIAGQWFDEATILQVAYAYEQASGWHTRRPPIPQEE
jgi:Asp-tRNA(Asn)/Glu-tRNA(Gln) amidotransferase A subunit family amidase